MDNPFLCTLLIAVHYEIYSFSDVYIVKTVTLEHQRLIIHQFVGYGSVDADDGVEGLEAPYRSGWTMLILLDMQRMIT